MLSFLTLLQISSDVQATGSFYAAIGTAILVFLLVSIVAILLSLHSIWNSSMSAGWRFKWTAVVVILGLVGCIAYFFIGRKEAKKEQDGEDDVEESEEKETVRPAGK